MTNLNIDDKDFGSPDVDEDLWELESRKIEQSAANYNPVGGTAERACASCQWFISPDNCATVQGWPHPITPNGLSDLWRERVIPDDLKEARDKTTAGRRRRKKPYKEEDAPQNSGSTRHEKGILARVMESLKLSGSGVKEYGSGPLKLYKGKDGAWRWMAYVTNNYRDRDNPPEIFEEKAHKEFIGRLDAGQASMPELWYWHTPGSRWGQATRMGYDDGLVWAVGTVDPGMEAVAQRVAAKADALGVSHGYRDFHYSDKGRGIISEYTMFEISPLPADRAANPITGFALAKEAQMQIAAEKRQELVHIFGEESVKRFEANGETLIKQAQELGLESKDLGTSRESDGPAPDGPETQKDSQPPAVAIDYKQIGDSAAKAIFESDNWKSMSGLVAEVQSGMSALTARVDKLEADAQKSLDDRVDRMIASRVINQGVRPSQSNENVVTREAAEKEYDKPNSVIDPRFMDSVFNRPA